MVKRNNCGKALDIARTARDMQRKQHLQRISSHAARPEPGDGEHPYRRLPTTCMRSILGRAITGIQAFS